MSKLLVSATHTWHCLPHVWLPFFALLSPPRLALHGFVQSGAIFTKCRHSILRTRDILFCENVGILCHVRSVHGVDRLLLQRVVFRDVLVIRAVVKPQADLTWKTYETRGDEAENCGRILPVSNHSHLPLS